MALNNTILEALNRHINEEFCASYLYLSMSAYCDSMDLPGFAYWMGIQSQEEYAHAMNLFDSVQDRQGWVTLHPIEQPAVDFDSVLGAMETTLGHEREVTKLVNQLYELATGSAITRPRCTSRPLSPNESKRKKLRQISWPS